MRQSRRHVKALVWVAPAPLAYGGHEFIPRDCLAVVRGRGWCNRARFLAAIFGHEYSFAVLECASCFVELDAFSCAHDGSASCCIGLVANAKPETCGGSGLTQATR